MDAKTALEIINEYNSAYEDDTPIPDTDEGLIERALYLYEEAKKLYDQGVKDNALQTILFFGSGEDVKDVRKTYPRRSSGGLSEGDERETLNVEQPGLPWNASLPPENLPVHVKEKLPVPPHIEGDAETLPRELDSVVDKEIRRLSGVYNAYLARATYLLGVEQADLMGSQHLLDDARASVLRSMDREKKLAKVIDAEIMADPLVNTLSEKVLGHEQNVSVLKALKEIYSGNIDRLSREWTMRQNEWEKSR